MNNFSTPHFPCFLLYLFSFSISSASNKFISFPFQLTTLTCMFPWDTGENTLIKYTQTEAKYKKVFYPLSLYTLVCTILKKVQRSRGCCWSWCCWKARKKNRKENDQEERCVCKQATFFLYITRLFLPALVIFLLYYLFAKRKRRCAREGLI